MNPTRLHAACCTLAVIAALQTSPAAAETPGFDRPGIAFATDTLPPGSFDLEQGLPDYARDSSDGVRSRSFGADSVVRVGLLRHVEAQISTSLFNRVDVDDHGDRSHVIGSGDTGLALKAALPSSIADVNWAALGRITFASGDPAFSAGHPTAALGVTGNWSPTDTQSVGLYANIDRSAGRNVYTVSPDWNFKLSDRLGAYLEAGRSFGNQTAEIDAGGGLAFMAWPTVQFDLSFLRGLSRASTDLQADFGVSAFFN